MMKRGDRLLTGVIGAALLLAGVPAQAALMLGPGDADHTSSETSALDGGDVANIFGTSTTLEKLYKAEVGTEESPETEEEGSFADSYETAFENDPLDPEDAVINYSSGEPAIGCPECYLVVKDGKNEPAQYLFNIGDWNGTDSIDLAGFWDENQGAISHVAIFGGGGTEVPAPGTLGLFGLSLLLLAGAQRRLLGG